MQHTLGCPAEEIEGQGEVGLLRTQNDQDRSEPSSHTWGAMTGARALVPEYLGSSQVYKLNFSFSIKKKKLA